MIAQLGGGVGGLTEPITLAMKYAERELAITFPYLSQGFPPIFAYWAMRINTVSSSRPPPPSV